MMLSLGCGGMGCGEWGYSVRDVGCQECPCTQKICNNKAQGQLQGSSTAVFPADAIGNRGIEASPRHLLRLVGVLPQLQPACQASLCTQGASGGHENV